MAVVVSQEHMAPEVWSAVIDHTPEIYDLLWDRATKKPRKLWALIYDDPEAYDLLYPPLELFKVDGDEKGLFIGGLGILHALGSRGIGPSIVDREYVSGADKLSNGGFDLGELYWRRHSEDSMWVLAAGSATNAGGLRSDDVLEYDRKFPARPGNEYQALMEGVTGAGRLRLRTIYEGRFNPADLLVNGDFEDPATGTWSESAHITLVDGGQRSGTRSMQVTPIPKPQLVSNSDFAFGAIDWSADSELSFAAGVLTCAPIPYPETFANGTLEAGTSGWNASTIGDIVILTDAANAHGGNNVMRAGPVTQKELLLNSSFDADLTNWWMSSDIPDPSDPGLFYWHATDGYEGSGGATTDGDAPVRSVRYLRADSVTTGGTDPYPVIPGETYECSCIVRRSPNANGHAYFSIALPHPDDIPAGQRWNVSDILTSSGDRSLPGETYHRLDMTITIPPNRFELDALFEVHGCDTGFWTVDEFHVIRTRGNRDKITPSTTIGVLANSDYRLSCVARSGGDQQVGNVQLGGTLTGAGMDNENITPLTQGNTDFVWTRLKADFTPSVGYTNLLPFVMAEDIVGDPVYLDDFKLEKISNNTRQTNHLAVPIVAGQRYRLAADVQSAAGMSRGDVRVGVVLSGPAVTDKDEAITQGETDGKVLGIETDFTPADGYDTATPYVRFKDIEGGSFTVRFVTITKMDNNTEYATGQTISAVPERTYRWLQAVRSGVNLQRGAVQLSAVCTAVGSADVVIFDSAPMEATAGEWRLIDFTFTLPSGYSQILPRIIGTDVEGDVFNLDDGEVRDTDDTTYVLDTWLDSPVAGAVNLGTTAPEGTESVRVAVIVDASSSGWSVDTVSLARTGVTPATGAAIIADLLTHLQTGNPLPITAGTITAPDVIPYDWQISRLTNRAALDHLCNVVNDPPLEYRVLPTLPATINVGPADVVCTTHPMADALLPEDRDVEDLSNPTTDTSERPTDVTVLGAEFETVAGRPFLVTATAQVPGPVELDLNGNPIVRTEYVQDATVDHAGYAEAMAIDTAARRANPALALSVELSGKDTRADTPPGDTVWAYHPESGLEDTSTDGVMIEGNTVFPRSARVLARERVHGPSHRIVMLRPDGTTFPLTGVRWSDEDAVRLTIGDRLPEWIADPQGLAPGIEYLRDRASRPR